MEKVWRGIKLGFIEWIDTLTPQHYVKFIGTLIKIIFIFVIARVVIRIGNAIFRIFKRRQETRFSLDVKKANTIKALSKSILNMWYIL